MNFLFFKKSPKEQNKPETAEQEFTIAVPSKSRLSYKPRSNSVVPPTANPFSPKLHTISETPRENNSDRSAVAAAPTASPSEDAKAASSVGSEAKLTLDSLLDCLPRELLKHDMGGVDPSTPVSIPLQVILSQLASGRVSMPLSELMSRLPQAMLLSPHPPLVDRVVDLPLHKVVPQLPGNIFSPNRDQESMLIEDNFLPTPFGDDPALEQLAAESEEIPETIFEPQTTEAVSQVAAPVAASAPVEQVAAPEPVAAVAEATAPLAAVAQAVVQTEEPPAPVTEQFIPASPASPPSEVFTPFQTASRAPEATAKPASEEPVAVTTEVPLATSAPEIFTPFQNATPVAEATPEPVTVEPPVITSKAPPAPPLKTIEPAPQPATVWPTRQVIATPAETTTPRAEMTPASAANEAPLTPLEQNQFLVNINECSAEDLTRVSGIGASLAQKIIDFRNLHGRITDINQLRQIPSLGNKTFRRIIGAGPAPRGKITRLVNYLVGAPQDRDLNIQEIVRHASQLPGVVGCIMAMEDGLFVTGQLPPSMDTQTVSAFAPQLFRRVSRYVKEMNVGRVRRFSLFTEEHPVSIFHTGKIYLIVLHAPNRFSKSLLIRFERITKEINRMCTERVAL